MIGRFINYVEERLIPFFLWCAILVPLLATGVAAADRYNVTDIDGLAGSGALSDVDDDEGDGWTSIGAVEWTQGKPGEAEAVGGAEPAPEAEAADVEAAGEPAAPVTKAPKSEKGSTPSKQSTGGTTRPSKGSGSGEGDAKGDGEGQAGSGSGGHHRPGTDAGGTAGDKKKCLDPSPRIKSTGKYRAQIDRAMIDFYAGSLKQMMTLGRVYAHDGPDGKADGFKITGMRCGNATHQAGFRNGDVVHRINGKKVNNITQAIAVYLKLRKEEDIEVDLTRKGEDIVLYFEIVE